MSTVFKGFRKAMARLPWAGHWPFLAALLGWHVAVLERSLRGSHGIPNRIIPYDFIDSYSRFLVFISDTLRAGAIPTWFPYGQAGAPFFMQPQSQLWSPLTWFVSLVFGYDLLVAQRQLLFILLFGSVGVYALAYNLWSRRSSALVAAIAFNFTSARLCNAEHPDIISAFSIIPWVLLGIRLLAQGKRWARPLLACALALLVVCGYPGVVILSPLWFGCWTIWLFVCECADKASRKRFVGGLLLSIGLSLGISAGFWLPIATNMATFTRGEPLTTDASLVQSLSPTDFWHLVFGAYVPLAPVGATADISMRGLYFGILAFALALVAVLSRRDRRTAVLAVGFVLALLMSLGSHFFARVAAHDYLSFLNFSRFPSADSRAMAVLAGSLLAGAGLASVWDDANARQRLFRVLGGLVVLLFLGLFWLKDVIYPGASADALAQGFTQVVFIELLVLAIALVCLARGGSSAGVAVCLIVLAALDSGMHAGTDAHLFARPKDDPSVRRGLDFRDIHVPGFDPASAMRPRVDAHSLEDVSSSDAFLNKTFYLASYTNFHLKRFDTVLAEGFRHFLVDGKRVVGFVGDSPPTSGEAFEKEAVAVDFQILRYLPDRVDYAVNLPQRMTLVFNEMYSPGWRARIDASGTIPMSEVAGGLRALTVEAGKHAVSTRYSPPVFWIGLVLTMLSWLAALVWLVREIRSARRRPPVPKTADA